VSETVYTSNEEALPSSSHAPLGLLAILGGINFFYTDWTVLYTYSVLIIFSFFYFIYYIFSSGEYQKILANMLLAVLVMCLAIIPIIGWIILILFILYNISKAIDGIKNLFPEACYSLAIYFLLGSKELLDLNIIGSIVAFILYLSITTTYFNRLSKSGLDTRGVLFRVSIMLLSIPLLIMLVISIMSALRNIFSFKVTPQQVSIKTPQQVSGYTRVSGVEVAGYTRQITTNVTQNVVTASAGSGAITSTMTRAITESLSEQDNFDDVQTPIKTVSGRDSEIGGWGRKSFSEDFLKNNIPPTDKNLSFYRFDELDNKKINNFIAITKKIANCPMFTIQDVIVYYDETVFGKGDQGIVITAHFLIVYVNLCDAKFYFPLNEIYNLTISGRLNKKIKFWDADNQEYEIELTQSNEGAKNIFNTIHLLK
jgi:hypothetical protein